jgi:alkaline phosphatase D
VISPKRVILSAISALAIWAAPVGAIEPTQSSAPLSRIAIGSCSRENLPQPIWEPMMASNPQLFIYAGDNIYADTTDPAIMREKYQIQSAQPGFAALRAKVPVIGTWDDHDYGQNDAGEENPIRAEAQQEFLDFFGVPKDSPRRTREGVYHSELYGPEGRRTHVILLDTRYHRSPLDRAPTTVNGRPYNGYIETQTPGATFLGEDQWTWLEEQLRVPAEVRLIVSSIQVISQEHPFEKWWNIPAERDRLYSLIRETEASGVIFLSGDRHLGELSAMDGGVGYPLYDLTSSGLTQASRRHRLPELNRHRVGGMPWGNHFAFVAIDWDVEDPIISLQLRDEEGDIRVQTKFNLSLLQFPAAK